MFTEPKADTDHRQLRVDQRQTAPVGIANGRGSKKGGVVQP